MELQSQRERNVVWLHSSPVLSVRFFSLLCLWIQICSFFLSLFVFFITVECALPPCVCVLALIADPLASASGKMPVFLSRYRPDPSTHTHTHTHSLSCSFCAKCPLALPSSQYDHWASQWLWQCCFYCVGSCLFPEKKSNTYSLFVNTAGSESPEFCVCVFLCHLSTGKDRKGEAHVLDSVF